MWDVTTTDDNQRQRLDELCCSIIRGVEFSENDGKAALFHAANHNLPLVVKRLFDADFDLNMYDDSGNTAVYYANENKSMDVLCQLICYEAEFELDDIDAKAVLFFAVENDRVEAVEALGDKGFDMNTRDKNGNTAVYNANQQKKINILSTLIDYEADFNLNDIDAKAVLFYAVENELLAAVGQLGDKGFDMNTRDKNGNTAVYNANQQKKINILSTLIDYEADFNLNDIDAKAVLFYAVENELLAAVGQLGDKGFDMNTRDKNGNTAVYNANQQKKINVLSTLINYEADFNLNDIDATAVLFYAVENELLVAVGELGARGFDMNTPDKNGNTAVYYAIQQKKFNILSYLINSEADFSFSDIDANAVLFYALKNNLFDTVMKLANRGFDLNTCDENGNTLVYYANQQKNIDMLSNLIYGGAHFKLSDIDAKSVLFFAVKFGLTNAVWQLGIEGFDMDTRDENGQTALYYANQKNHIDVLCALIGCGAEFNSKEIDRKAILFHGAKFCYKEVVEPLHKAGLDLDQTDNQGKTVAFYGDNDFLDALMEVVEEFVIDARDHYGRTPLFYALQDDDTTKAQYLIENGANLRLKDNCNVSIFTFFIETCISKNLKAMDLFTSRLFQEEPQRKALIRKALIHAIFNIIYCQAPLLYLTSFSHLLKPYAIFNETNVLEALAFAREESVNQDSDKIENIDKVVQMIKEKMTDVPRIISLLINLGADPQTTDSDGNTTFHYATLLPLYGVTQGVVMDICKKLKRFGTIFHAKNHQHESPLLFCLSSNTWKVVFENNSWQSSVRGLVEVCRFLLSSRDVMTNSEFIFHRIISLIQQGLNLNGKSHRKAVVEVLSDILELLQPHEDAVRNAVNYTDTLLNSPLHLWASIALKTLQDYEGCNTEDFTFKCILERILSHLLKCGAERNARNVYEETPLHMCRTWAAVTLLLDAGANPNDQNSSGHSPLFVAAKKEYASAKKGYLYPDVTEDPESFWKNAFQKGLDPWVVCKQRKTILNVLIESEEFELSRDLVKIACEDESTADNVKLSILNVICNDESKHTHWKTFLVKIILESAKTSRLALESPLRLCCRNMVKYGMFDDGQPVSEIQQRENEKSSYDDGRPLAKKARRDESVKEEKKKQESKEEQFSNDSVYYKIAKQLRLYAPDIDINAIANDYPSLQDLLTKPIETDKIPILVPWASVSVKHKAKLAKVARRREATVAGQIWYHRDKIGNGSFGSIFAGINKKDGGEVAVKRIDKSRLEQPEDKREIENLVRLADCAQVVRYISFFENEDFSHVVQELMEGNLVEFLSGCKIDAALATRLCKDVVLGVQFIHKEGILHRDLKPENILYKVHPEICLKIADFGLSRTIGSVCTSVFGKLVGSRCWMAPEVFTPVPNSIDKTPFAKESDVFSCGMILHYILSGGKHPFNTKDCTNENGLQVSHETETNIMNGNMCGWDNALCPEATHLVKKMLERTESNRPSSAEALNHPLFWSNDKKLDFLVAVSKNENFRSDHDPDIEVALRNSKHRARWTNGAYKHMKAFHDEMSGYRNYRVKSVVDLVRFIRNVHEHYKENNLRHYVGIESLLFTNYVFFNNFPNLVLEVYKYVTEHELDEAPEIKRVMNNEY